MLGPLRYALFIPYASAYWVEIEDYKNGAPLKLGRDELVELIEGVSFGFFLQDNVKIIYPCIEGFEDVESEFETVVSLLRLSSTESALKALKILSVALKDIPETVQKCGATESQVEKVMAALHMFKNPMKFAYTAGKNIIVNGKEIYNELLAASDNWESYKYKMFGYEIGLALHKVILGTVQPAVTFTPDDAIEVVMGLETGLFLGETKLEPACIKDEQKFWVHVNKAFDYFDQCDEGHARKGLGELAAALEVVHDALRHCKAAEDSLEKVAEAIAIFKHPMHFAYTIYKHIMVNGVNIIKELKTARSDWKKDEYKDFGYQFGVIAHQILVGKSSTPPDSEPAVVDALTFRASDALKLIVGVEKGFFEGNVKMEPECIADEKELAKHVNKAFALFGKMTQEDAAQGLKELSEAMEIVQKAEIECKAEAKHLEKLERAIAMMKDPKTFVWTIYRNILVNGVELFHKLKAAEDDWNESEYEECGVQFGLMYSQVLIGDPDKNPNPVPNSPADTMGLIA